MTGKPFEVADAKALLTAAILAVVQVAAAALRARFGDSGLVAAAAMAGFADAHAAAVSMASQVAAGKLVARDACMPILVGFTTNSISKIVLASATGSPAFALRVVPGLIIVLAAAWTGFVIAIP